jgi:TRAP transporter TAXI family solute receptor
MRVSHSLAAVAAASILFSSYATAQVVGIGSNPQGTVFYNAAAAIGKLMNDQMNVKARIQPFSGSTTFSPLLNTNEIQLGLINAGDAAIAYRGTDNYKGRSLSHLRLLGELFPLRLSCAVPNDSSVENMAQLKGKKMPSRFIAMTSFVHNVGGMLASAGLSPSDTRPYPVPNAFQGFEALGNGKVDAACISLGVAAITKVNIELKDHGGLRFLSIGTSTDGVAAMKKILPSRPILVKPAPNLVGVRKPTWFMAVSVFLAANDKMSDDFAYRLVKTIHDQKAELRKMNPLFNLLEPNGMYQPHPMPYHPGALRYYKEIGQKSD